MYLSALVSQNATHCDFELTLVMQDRGQLAHYVFALHSIDGVYPKAAVRETSILGGCDIFMDIL
jgi:hypothetical protein